jgi:hypothetical protein
MVGMKFAYYSTTSTLHCCFVLTFDTPTKKRRNNNNNNKTKRSPPNVIDNNGGARLCSFATGGIIFIYSLLVEKTKPDTKKRTRQTPAVNRENPVKLK